MSSHCWRFVLEPSEIVELVDLVSEIVVQILETFRPGLELLGPLLQPLRHALDLLALAVELDLEVLGVPVVRDEKQRADDRR